MRRRTFLQTVAAWSALNLVQIPGPLPDKKYLQEYLPCDWMQCRIIVHTRDKGLLWAPPMKEVKTQTHPIWTVKLVAQSIPVTLAALCQGCQLADAEGRIISEMKSFTNAPIPVVSGDTLNIDYTLRM